MKVLAFGDSFVKMFLHCEPQVKHWKFKGKSVKGLVKADDFQRKKIQRQIRKAPNGTKILLLFGQVDFNYVRYYKIIKNEPAITQQIFQKYVQWVSSMNFKKNISIVSIFPTPIKKQKVISSLINKGSYLLEEQTAQIDQKILDQFDKSQQTWYQWNSWISTYCKKQKVDNIVLFQKNFLHPEFYDLSGLTIHLRYVPVLKLVKKYVDISFDQEKAEKIEKEYEKEKTVRIANSILRVESQRQQSVSKIQSQQICIQNSKIQTKQQKQIKIKRKFTAKEVPLSKIEANLNVQTDKKQEKQSIEQYIGVQLKKQRKRTADLDTDTNLQKQSERSKQQNNDKQKSSKQQLKQSQQTKGRFALDSPQQSQKTKKKNKTKKNIKYKQKQKYNQKQKKKERAEESEDEPERFFQLLNKKKAS